MATSRSQPTTRQREYLSFIKAFTDRWGVPPSFEEIGRHFETTAPSVNGMVKTLEARGFLSRVPGAARTLRVLVADRDLCQPARSATAPTTATDQIDVAVRMASIVIERLVPALKGADRDHVHRALTAVAEALDVTLRTAGASDEQRRAADETLLRVASIAQGDSTEIRPGRKVPWWRHPHPR
jgi:SOS-response transcriptional repressor LexA